MVVMPSAGLNSAKIAASQIDFAGCDGVGVADEADLGLEHAMFVTDTLRTPVIGGE